MQSKAVVRSWSYYLIFTTLSTHVDILHSMYTVYKSLKYNRDEQISVKWGFINHQHQIF